MRVHTLCAALLFIPAILLGQNETSLRVPEWTYPDLKAFLSLTDAQVTALTANLDNQSRALSNIYNQINEKYATLYQLLESGGGTATQLGQMLIDIQGLQRQIPQVDRPFRTQAANVLTTDQKNKLPALVEAMRLQPSVWQAQSLLLVEGYPATLAATTTGEGRLESTPGITGMPVLRHPALPGGNPQEIRTLPAVVR